MINYIFYHIKEIDYEKQYNRFKDINFMFNYNLQIKNAKIMIAKKEENQKPKNIKKQKDIDKYFYEGFGLI